LRNECVPRCHVELSRDIWILPKLAFRPQQDASTSLSMTKKTQPAK